MRRSALAPAKVNLFLHVGGLDAEEGRHPVSSLMVFANIGDRVTIEPADHPEFVLDGPMSAQLLSASADENLVIRARDLILQRLRRPVAPFRLTLIKSLPVASGLGGGSSDAGATLSLVRDALDLPLDDMDLQGLAAQLGSDGPACFRARPTLASGWGDELGPAPDMPVLHAVLVNPGVPCSTAAVYAAFDRLKTVPDVAPPPMPALLESIEEVAAWLSFTRNDLEGPAEQICPDITDVLATLRDERETLLARVSGSGATCFALCAGDYEAQTLLERINDLRPDWWARVCRLGGPWTG